MYILIALVCMLDDTPRGHHCETVVYPTQHQTIMDCRREKYRLMFHELPARQEKMAMGDCVYRQVKTVIM